MNYTATETGWTTDMEYSPKLEMQIMEDIYNRRMKGETGIWSSFTRCVKCGERWAWSVKDNLQFVCSKHQEKTFEEIWGLCKHPETESDKHNFQVCSNCGAKVEDRI